MPVNLNNIQRSTSTSLFSEYNILCNTSSGAPLSFVWDIFAHFDGFLVFVDKIMEITDSALTINNYLWARA